MPAKGHRKALPSLRHHKASGRAVVTLAGKDVYCGDWDVKADKPTPAASRAYDVHIANWIGMGRPSVQVVTGEGMALADLLALYIANRQARGCKENTIKTIRLAFSKSEPYWREPACKFGAPELKAVRRMMVEAGWTRTTINYCIGVYKSAYKWAGEEQAPGTTDTIIPIAATWAIRNVASLKRGETTAKENPPVRAVAIDVVERTLEACQPTLAALLRVQWLCGMRPGEACRMTTRDIDTTNPNEWTYTPRHHKTERHGHTRQIPIGPRAQAIIGPRLQTNLDAPLFSPKQVQAERFAAMRERATCRRVRWARSPRPTKGTREAQDFYNATTYAQAVRMACKRAYRPEGMKRAEFEKWECPFHWHPNQLRHLKATQVRRIMGLDAASATLGHANLDTSLIYAERAEDLARQVAAKTG